jgi:hypothetical protein
MPREKLEEMIRTYAGHHIGGALVHIMDPVEESFAFQGRVELRGCEQEPHLLLPNAAEVRAAYAEKLAEHKAFLKHLAHSAGWLYTHHVTSSSPHPVMLQLYQFLTSQA